MNFDNWKEKIDEFFVIDLRNIQGNFFEGLKKKAEQIEIG